MMMNYFTDYIIIMNIVHIVGCVCVYGVNKYYNSIVFLMQKEEKELIIGIPTTGTSLGISNSTSLHVTGTITKASVLSTQPCAEQVAWIARQLPLSQTTVTVASSKSNPKPLDQDEEIEETPLTCTICQDTYSDPRVLPCLHSFCKSCLSKLASISTSVKCPLCRNEHAFSAKGVDELLPNTQLARKVEKLSTTTEKSKCDQCEGDTTDVVSFCSNCEGYLCESCDGAHKKMLAFKSHVLMLPKLAKKNPKVEGFICPKHIPEALTVYCIDCKSVICRDCAIYNHNGHKFKPAVDVSDRIKKILLSDSKQLETKLEAFRSHAEGCES